MAAETHSGQRARLLAAVVRVSAEHGYASATVARVIEQAGVSRASFYEHFADRADCFLAGVAEVEGRALEDLRRKTEGRAAGEAVAAALTALVELARKRPLEARCLMNETMAGGPRALAARERGIQAIARLIEQAHADAGAEARVPAAAAEVLVGATYRLLAARLRAGEPRLAGLGEELARWAGAYAQPARAQRWQRLDSLAAPARSPFLARAPLEAPPALAPGRPARPKAAVAENHRLRIVFATAELIRAHGYGETSVAAITRAAGVDGRAFYRVFKGREEAVAATHAFFFQNAMAVAAGAFFAFEQWPRRVWEAGRTLLQLLAQNPALTHACVVEGHAGAPASVRRLEELQAGFTIFLQEGYRQQPPDGVEAPSRVALEAIAHANFELIHRQARSDPHALAGLEGRFAFTCLAPFLGAARAGELVEELRRQPRGADEAG
ncbi:MAG TPA: helix-turn-helix domain-containing protein [Solirubrobacteraceae bacterium]|jgi:AcrR family transcriptional regulator|nr:helix-turn-helix domain-containing protein [Solirubrobacteraceae bacterium]